MQSCQRWPHHRCYGSCSNLRRNPHGIPHYEPKVIPPHDSVCHGRKSRHRVTKTPLLSMISHLQIIFAAYRLAIAKAQPDPLATSTKITFYVLNPLPQLVCCVLYFVPKVKQLYPEAHFQPRARPTYDDQYPQSGYLPNAAQYSNNSGYNPNQPSYPPPMSPSKEEYKQVV